MVNIRFNLGIQWNCGDGCCTDYEPEWVEMELNFKQLLELARQAKREQKPPWSYIDPADLTFGEDLLYKSLATEEYGNKIYWWERA